MHYDQRSLFSQRIFEYIISSNDSICKLLVYIQIAPFQEKKISQKIWRCPWNICHLELEIRASVP